MAPATDKGAFLKINSLFFCHFHLQKQPILFVCIITSSEYFYCCFLDSDLIDISCVTYNKVKEDYELSFFTEQDFTKMHLCVVL